MKLAIEGMSCQACVRRVKKALDTVPDITVQSVQVGSAELEAQPAQEQAVIEAVRKAGYEASVHADR